jgi:hypothetical protein
MINDVRAMKESMVNPDKHLLYYYLTGNTEKAKDALNKMLYKELYFSFTYARQFNKHEEVFNRSKEEKFSYMQPLYEMIGANIPEKFRSVSYNQMLDTTTILQPEKDKEENK